MPYPAPRVLALAVATALLSPAAFAQTVQAAATTLKAAEVKSIEFRAKGHWYQFGQAPAPKLDWPQFDVSKYLADINYETASAKVEITRQQTEEPGRRRPAPTTQWANQYVSGKYAWNLPAAHLAQNPAAQPATLEERRAEIWSTPQGFLKAAQANNASSKTLKDGFEVSFTSDGKYRYVGHFNSKNQLDKVSTWIDTPVLGDTLVETTYSDYQDFKGIPFPTRILRKQGGHPVLALKIEEVKINPTVDIAVPANVENFKPAAVTVKCDKLAEGVYYLTGGTHHSVVIEQKDHIVLVEAPLNEERSLALIEKLKEVVPGKPIKYLINTHAHFDHSGGLRTFVDAGAIIVTHKLNESYYKEIWANPHSLNPDRLAVSKKAAKFETFSGKHTLSDGQRRIEIYPLAGSAHNDGFALVYLPQEKVLVEADAFTPLAADAPLPATVNPYSVNLLDNIEKQKLAVDKIAALHGPRVTSLDDLRAFVGLR